MENKLTPVFPCGKPAGRPKASDVEARLQNLLHTAGQLFLQHGYSKVSLEMIAREAHVAVRTIYVKFGGKAGLFQAVLVNRRDAYFNTEEMDQDRRPVREVIANFSRQFFALITSPAALRISRLVVAESGSNPELAQAFLAAGPLQTRAMLARFFARPEVRAQLRDDVAIELLPTHLLNCVMGDQIVRLMVEPSEQDLAESACQLEARVAMFFRSVLREP